MKQREILSACACALLLSACNGGSPQASVPQNASAPAAVPSGYLVPQFVVTVPKTQTQTQSVPKKPQYISASTLSVDIVLNTLNASPPPNGLTTSAVTDISSGSCASGCTVNGPPVPPGNDNFTITAYDASNAGGNALSALTQTFTVTAGQSNTLSATLDGIPASFLLTGVPSATAGTALNNPATLTLAVLDADGNTITGTYANAVTLSDGDVSSLTNASALAVNSGTAASSVTITKSTDIPTLSYGGQAIAQATLSASATGATGGTAHFTPTLNAISLSPSEVDLYATSGTGSTGTITASEVGWSNSPYDQVFAVSVPAGCANIATVTGNLTSTTGTSFTVSIAGSPAVGSCTATFRDGAGQTQNAALTYTTSSFSIDAAKRRANPNP